jgi:hypothetical protein
MPGGRRATAAGCLLQIVLVDGAGQGWGGGSHPPSPVRRDLACHATALPLQTGTQGNKKQTCPKQGPDNVGFRWFNEPGISLLKH